MMPKTANGRRRRAALTPEQRRIHNVIRDEARVLAEAKITGEWVYTPSHIPTIFALLSPAVTLACQLQRRSQWRGRVSALFVFHGKEYRLRRMGPDTFGVRDPSGGHLITTARSPSLW